MSKGFNKLYVEHSIGVFSPSILYFEINNIIARDKGCLVSTTDNGDNYRQLESIMKKNYDDDDEYEPQVDRLLKLL